MSETILKQDDGPDVHVWERHGEGWACCAPDHGPLCRLCQRVDEALLGILQGVQDGTMRCRAKPDGEFEAQVTAKGRAAAEALTQTVGGALVWGQIQRDLREGPE